MKKIIPTGVLCLCLLIVGCTEPYIDSEKIYTVTFFPNGGSISVTSMQTDVKGRLASLPSAVREDDKNPDTGETIRSYAFTGWFTTGGTKVSLKTVFHSDTLVLARWKASDETDTEQPGPLADWLAFLQSVDPLPSNLTFDVNADENIKPQTLTFGGKQITVTLHSASNLNIHTLFLSGFGALFTVESGVTLILDNIRLVGKRNTSSMIVINPGGKVILNDGTVITGNGNEKKEFGGGVTVNISAVFEMKGGEIIGNYSVDPTEPSFLSAAGGGGVLVNGGEFTMTGGRIAENDGANGGGVLVKRGGTFTMEVGHIYKNAAYEGGGVKVVGAIIDSQDPNALPHQSIFTIKGGRISDNNGTGGGVAVGFRGIFNLEDGEISKNTGSDAGGLYNRLGTVYMYGGEISDNRGPWSAGGVMNQGQFYMYGGEISRNFGGLGGGVANFVPSVLGLGGFFHMWGGKITGNTGDGSGGGVTNDAFFYMHGGEISGNRANVGQGGGVYNGNPAYEDDGLFVITGGIIYGKDKPTGTDDTYDYHTANWDSYANIDNGGGSRGGAIYLLGGLVAWGRIGYYDLDNHDLFDSDDPNKTGPLPKTTFTDMRPSEEELKDGKDLAASVSIGKPSVTLLYWGDKDGKKKYVPNIKMDENYAKQATSNSTIRVDPEKGVYIDGTLEVNFATFDQ